MEQTISKFTYRTRFLNRRLTILSGTSLALTPLVDVIFLLLIFFMIGSSFVFQTGTTVSLPETKQEFKSVADKLIITLTKEKLLFFNDQLLEDWTHLEQRLANMAWNRDPDVVGGGRKGRPPIIMLKADKDVPYDDIMKVMSITRLYGMNIFLVTKTEGT